jgi:hypothetical protein
VKNHNSRYNTSCNIADANPCVEQGKALRIISDDVNNIGDLLKTEGKTCPDLLCPGCSD